MALKRLPSEVYWGGLGSWGIRTFRGHIWAYFRSLDGYYRRRSRFLSTPRDPEGRRAPPANWHPHRPDPPAGFPYENVSVALRREDAEYLRDRIQARHPGSLLAVLAGRANAEDLGADRPWKHSGLSEVSTCLRQQLHDARLFSICLHGATLLYNLMLSELQQHENRIKKHREALEAWTADVRGLKSELDGWHLNGVWNIVRSSGLSISYPMKHFIEGWVKGLKRSEPEAVRRAWTSTPTAMR